MQGCSVRLLELTLSFRFADKSFISAFDDASTTSNKINELMDGASKIYMDNFGFGLGTYPFLTILAIEIFIDASDSILNDKKTTGTVDFDLVKKAAFAALTTQTKSKSNYCSVLTLYHFYLLILQDC